MNSLTRLGNLRGRGMRWGVLVSESSVAPESSVDLVEWPPSGSVSVDLDGSTTGWPSTGTSTVRRSRDCVLPGVRDDEVFAEIGLPEPAAAEAGTFGIHPALLDAATARWRWRVAGC